MKALHYKEERTINKKRIIAEVSLADDCKNGHCDFSATCLIYEKLRNGRWDCVGGGADHDAIRKYFPHLSEFCDLHLSNSYGQPMYAVENGIYLLTHDGLKVGAEYLRIPEGLAQTLSAEKEYFKYQLFDLGIVDMWKEQAEKAIAHLEELTGEKFEDYDNPKALSLTFSEIDQIKARIKAGYYSPDTTQERKRKEEEAKKAADRAKLEERYDTEIANAEREKEIMLLVFDYFGTTDNVILYNHSKELTFNWSEPQWATYKRRYTKAEFESFCNDCGDDLPIDIKPVMAYDYKY